MASNVKIRVIGKKIENASLWLTTQGNTGELFPGVQAFGIELATESARGSSQSVLNEIPAGALVEVEVEGNLHFWTTADDLRERLADPDNPDARGVDSDGAWTLPASLDLPDARRGFYGKLALKALRWLDIHPDDALRDTIVERAQNRAVPTEGLFPVDANGSLGASLASPIPDGGPVLILLHGTASSTIGSFSRLWTDQTEKWKALRKHFGERIYALEHWTLTRSPIENALRVARLLPQKGKVSLLSHSRGGLVGEMLCLDPGSFDLNGALAALDAEKANNASESRAIDSQKADLRELLDELFKRPALSIDRFVRAACPSRGTSLAGDKLDKFSSLLVLAAIGLEMKESGKRSFGGPVGKLIGIGVDTLWETVAAVLTSRRRPDELPGLQAMMPGSSLVSIINTAPARGELFVIAGDAAPVEGDRLAALRIWLADRFYERDHDLVVDTRSMLDGARRTSAAEGPRCKVQFRSGADVNHFSYFRNDDSAGAIVAALTHAADADDRFKDYLGEWPLADGTGEHARGWFSPRNQKDPTGPDVRGTVILIPGLCGSELLVNEDETWANLLALAGGAFRKKLNIKSTVTAGGPLADTYVPLANTLRQRGYKVTMHGYDWRQSLSEALPKLVEAIDAALKATIDSRKPVHFVVHSMGGVLLRAAFASDKDLWARWNSHPGDPRVLMLGTPNQGSHAITLLLTGRDTFFRQLALLDVCHSQEELLKTAIHFPGVMELLPFTPDGDDKNIRDLVTWEAFQKADGGSPWPLPIAEVLSRSRDIWRTLDADPLLLSPRLVYVAGVAEQTPEKALIDAKGRFQLMATPQGDGRVPWATGIPESCMAGERVYYVRAAHGDLPKASDAYDGYLDLLEKGRSDKLATHPPISRGSSQSRAWRTEESEAALFPSRGELIAAATGGTLRSARKVSRSNYRTEVRVLHGDLLYAESAVMVGHTWGANALEFAEKLLDQALGGRMQKRLDAGLHAGALGTFSIYRKNSNKGFTKGAIVIGMGRIGQLSGGQLSQAVSRAVASFAIEELEAHQAQGADGANDEPLSLGVSTLLIGAGIGELTLQDSVAAIMRGHRDARLRLRQAGLASRVRLARLDFIEVLEDKAIHALRAARDTVDVDTELARSFFVDAAIRPHPGHRRRAAATAEEGLWQRIAISTIGNDDAGAPPRLMFDAYGELARAERTYNAIPFKDIERFTESLIGSTVDQEQVGRALFELLVPNWLKDLAPDRRRTQLVLDKTAAAYPWELLRDRATDHESDSGQPLSVRSGLIRQLTTGQFRLNVRRANNFKALVVGDPELGEWARFLRPLEGAVKEARAVATQLESAGIPPSLHVQDEARQILLDLFSDEWRILHLSGHGVYEQNIPATETLPAMKKATGMVIGGGDLLTPAHIEQMRAVPDFVFLNCCNLGRIEETSTADLAGRPGTGVRPGSPGLAANLATQLIEAGVRCVIAAGWEVRDDAAQLFAETFYDRFLAGESFGESVLAARRTTFEQYSSSNTWGAYQCYGDPGFVLSHPRQAAAKQPRAPRYDYLSATEVLYELERLTLRAGLSRELDKDAETSPERHSKPLLALCERQGWITRGDILEGFGRLFAEYSFHHEAIDFYRRALSAPDGSASRKAEEQLANMLTRRAKVLADKGQHAAATDTVSGNGNGGFDEAFTLLDRATAILAVSDPDRQPNAERLNLQAAVEKRRLLCQIKAGETTGVQPTLEAMLRFSSLATDKTREEGGDVCYPALNAANACALCLLVGAAPSPESLSNVKHNLQTLRDAEASTPAKGFWGKAARADLLLAEGLFALASSNRGKKKLDEARDAYQLLMSGQVAPRERESVSSTIDILLLVITHLSPASGKEEAAATAKSALVDIKAALTP